MPNLVRNCTALGVVFAVILLTACETIRQTGEESAAVSIAREVALQLPPVPGYEGRLEAVQTVVASHETRKTAFQATLSADAERVDIVMVALNGPRIMEIAWTENGVEETRYAYTPENLSGLNVLADIFLVFWPQAKVSEALPKGVSLEEADNSRKIRYGGTTIIEIRYDVASEGGRQYQELTNLDLGYSLKIYSQSP
ncbi:DUF3261 domain-containing protein [Henriciella sp.]|uniref:DUF3261 domain-containing protein n=1 Tax=Henriciella sp. TaxID=1968823 RepID=UPI00261EEA2D|nr:DUF3261 domain-containing protein [Henriciella sp.]